MDGIDLDALIAGHHNANLVWFENPLAVSRSPSRKAVFLEGFDMNEFKPGTGAAESFSLKAAPGRPWIWRARFWSHEPQTDLALLEKGWHLTYSDVGNLFGSPQAVALWDDFYAKMTSEHGLAKKVASKG